METVAQVIIIVSGVWLVVVAFLMLLVPRSVIKYIGKAASTNLINYSELILRGIWGLALMYYAEFSLFPGALNIFGMFLVGTTTVLLLVPRKWHARYAMMCSQKLSSTFVMIISPFSLAFGIFFIYTVI